MNRVNSRSDFGHEDMSRCYYYYYCYIGGLLPARCRACAWELQGSVAGVVQPPSVRSLHHLRLPVLRHLPARPWQWRRRLRARYRMFTPWPHLPLPFHLLFPSLFPFLSGGVLAWLSVHSAVQTCIWPSWCHCHSLSLASVKSRLVLPYWYRLTRRIVPDKGPLSGCCCCFVVLSLSCPAVLFPILLTLLSFSFPPALPYHFFPSPSLPPSLCLPLFFRGGGSHPD